MSHTFKSLCLLGLIFSCVFSAPLTDPNDPRSWQGATINTFAQLLKGADTLANRQALIDAQTLDDGYITADISQTGTLVPNSWANSYAGCSGASSNNNYDYTCSSGKNIFELANQLDSLWFQSSGTLGQTVWDLGVDAPQAGIFVTVDHGPLPLECIESSHYLAPSPTGPWTLTEVVKVYLQGYLPDNGAQNIYDGFAYVVRHPTASSFRYISTIHGGLGALQSDGDDEINGVVALDLNFNPVRQPFTTCVNISTTLANGARSQMNPVLLNGRWSATAPLNYAYDLATRSSLGRGNPKPKTNSLQVFFAQDYQNQFTLNFLIDANDGTAGTATVNINTKYLGADAQIMVYDDPASSAASGDDAVDSYSWFASTGQGQFTWSWGKATTDGLVLGPIEVVKATSGFEIEIEVTSSTGLTDITIVHQPTGNSADNLVLTSYPIDKKLVIKRDSCYCGNGVIDKLEECDGTGCCTPSCTIAPGGYTCRAGQKGGNPCDLPEVCAGGTPNCPPDVVLNGSACNPLCPPGYSDSNCSVPICSYWTSCDNCTAVAGCGWCCESQQCIAGDASSPKGGVTCPSYQYGTCACNPGCGPAGTCDCGKCKCDIGRTGATCDLYLGCDGVSYTTPAQLPQLDACGVCNGTNSTCLGCDGVPFGLQLDHCGVCGGDGRSCMDGCGYNSDCQSCIKDDKCQWCYSADYCADKVHVYECPSENWVTTSDKCVQILGLTVAEASGVGAGVIAAIAIGAAAFAGAAIFGGKKGYDAYMKHRNNMGNAQSNPMYNDSGRSGTSPLYEMSNK